MNLRRKKDLGNCFTVLVVVALLFVGRAGTQDAEPAPTKERPVLELDLRKFGYERYRNSHTRWRSFVDFTDVNHIALGWLTSDDRAAAEKAGSLTPTPAHLHVLVLDAVTSEKQGLEEWPTPSTPVRFLGVRDGKFLACTGHLLRLFSSKFEVIQEQDLPNERGCINSTKRAGVSPSRRSVLLSFPSAQSDGRTLLNDTLLDIETFTPIAKWTEERSTNDVSDHWLLGLCGQPEKICVRAIDQSWQALPADSKDIRALDFVNNDTFAIQSGNDTVVMKVDGRVLFQVKLPQHRFAVQFVASSGGERFAAMEDRLRGLRSEALDMYPLRSDDRVVIYSIPDGRSIYAVSVKGASPWPTLRSEDRVNQVALSPDGTLIALVSGNTLRVYRIPDGSDAQR